MFSMLVSISDFSIRLSSYLTCLHCVLLFLCLVLVCLKPVGVSCC